MARTTATAITPRMVEGRFMFQVATGVDQEVMQFDVRFFLRDGKLRTSIDIHGNGPGTEDLDPTVLAAVDTAIETVKGRVRVEELFEQVE